MEWRKVVDGLPAHWFPGASYSLLEVYCQVTVNTRWLAAQMAAHERGSPEWRQWHNLWGNGNEARRAAGDEIAPLSTLGADRGAQGAERAAALGPQAAGRLKEN